MGVSHETYHAEFDQTTNRNLARQYVEANLLAGELSLHAEDVAGALRHIVEINQGNDIYVLDGGGRVLESSVDDTRIAQRRIPLDSIREFLSAAPEFPLRGDDPAHPGRREVFSAAPLSIPGSTAANLYIVLHRPEHTDAAGGLKSLYAVREALGIVSLAIILALAGSLLPLRMLTRRLGALKHDIERFREGELLGSATLAEGAEGTGDEIERLRHLFMQLVEKIRRQMQELRKTDEMRRELLTNVSHDLRTPLATLSAHLESLLLNEDMPKDELRAYLVTAFSQCRRLSKLVEQLLELAKLARGCLPLPRSHFSWPTSRTISCTGSTCRHIARRRHCSSSTPNRSRSCSATYASSSEYSRISWTMRSGTSRRMAKCAFS